MKPSVWDKTFTDAASVTSVEYEPQLTTAKPSRPERSRPPQRNDERYEAGEGDLKWSSRPSQAVQRLDERYEGDYETPRATDDRRYERTPTRREPLPGKKTYLWAAGYALAGVAALMGVEIPGVELSSADAIGMIWEAGSWVFIRLGISKIFKSNN